MKVGLKLVWLIPMAALAVALLDMPYGYYGLLRVLVCGACAYLAAQDANHGKAEWAWVLGGCAVLYNPIFKIPLGRELWAAVNVATILMLGLHMWSSRNRAVGKVPDTSEPV
jgi:hypothetical protein